VRSSPQRRAPLVRGRLLRAGMWVSVLCLALIAPASVHAKREMMFSYPYVRVWTAAVRLMRVDFESTITEKDKDDGYFLFEYPDRGKSVAGSMELIASKQGDVESVRVVLQIASLPTYVENMILERLSKKLEQEFGAPKEAKKPEPPKDKDDGDGSGDGVDKPKPAPKPKIDAKQGGNTD
jgi:hypothetical protein